MVCVLVAVVPFRLGRAPRLRDHMDIAVGDEAPGVARLDRTEPERRVSRLRRQYIRDVGPLNILIVQRLRIQHWISARRIRAVDIDRKPSTVPHGDTDVPLLDHRFTPAFATLSVDVLAMGREGQPRNAQPDESDNVIFLYDRKV